MGERSEEGLSEPFPAFGDTLAFSRDGLPACFQSCSRGLCHSFRRGGGGAFLHHAGSNTQADTEFSPEEVRFHF